MKHLLTVSPLNQVQRWWELKNWSPIQEAPDFQTNSPCQCYGKFKENSVENSNINISNILSESEIGNKHGISLIL